MKCKRIISKLEIKGPNLVKGVNLEGMRVLGKPDEFSKLYYNENIDELYYSIVKIVSAQTSIFCKILLDAY